MSGTRLRSSLGSIDSVDQLSVFPISLHTLCWQAYLLSHPHSCYMVPYQPPVTPLLVTTIAPNHSKSCYFTFAVTEFARLSIQGEQAFGETRIFTFGGCSPPSLDHCLPNAGLPIKSIRSWCLSPEIQTIQVERLALELVFGDGGEEADQAMLKHSQAQELLQQLM